MKWAVTGGLVNLHQEAGQTPPDDLTRPFYQFLNNLSSRFDLMSQTHALSCIEAH